MHRKMIKENFFLIVGLYIIFFAFYTAWITFIPKTKKLIFCSICFAWASVLIFSLLFDFGLVYFAFAIGMSVTGISYKLKEKYPDYFWLFQFGLTTLGLIILMFLESKGI